MICIGQFRAAVGDRLALLSANLEIDLDEKFAPILPAFLKPAQLPKGAPQRADSTSVSTEE